MHKERTLLDEKRKQDEKRIRMTTQPHEKLIFKLAIPSIISMLITSFYNLVDTFFVGQLENTSATGAVGVCFSIMAIIQAFGFFFGHGSGNYISRELGKKNIKGAEEMASVGFFSAIIVGITIMVFGLIFLKPLAKLLGSTDSILPYAVDYLRYILIGAPFTCGLFVINNQLRFQSNALFSMIGVVSGAVINVILDPILIFGCNMGVAGAALATIISQALSAVWVLRFLTGKRVLIPLTIKKVRISRTITKDILRLGASNFIMQGTNCLVQVICNSTLQNYGGDIYVGIMTVANSVREIFMLPISGIVNGAQPVISFNYGAKAYGRVKDGIRFNTWIGTVYTMFAWLLVLAIPKFWFQMFSDDVQMLDAGVQALKIYFFGFVFMSLQFAGQSTFQALGDAKHAIFFSLLRKAIIVVPLTMLLPAVGFGVNGVFLAEPISNIIGGIACYVTMRMTIYRKLCSQSQDNEIHFSGYSKK